VTTVLDRPAAAVPAADTAAPAAATAPPAAPVPTLSADELVALVTRISVEPGRWRHLVRFDAEQRQWAKLPSPPGVDVWVLTWLPDQTTDLHDHGHSTAAYTVVSGAIDEVRTVGAHLRTSRLVAGQTRWLSPGAIHDIRGAAVGPAVSIHAYSPPLEEMTWYDEDLHPVRSERTTDPEG
jgi:mannose-6-phosphate isomerase-like protein (cupin superfamily)